MHELKITMLGPSGVGKTTLLTAMYEQFESNIGKTNLQLTPDEESSAILQERLIELKTLLDDFETTGGIQGTEGEPDALRSFIFKIGKKGHKPSFTLNFQDYPGGYHAATDSPEKRDFLKKIMKESVAVLIAIDAPALMEQKGKWHDRINKPLQITNQFKTAYEELDSARLVIFAPVKCETYLQNEASAQELLSSVKKAYANLIDLFDSEKLRSKVAVVVTPVQTVGSVIFSKVDTNGSNTPHFYFRKISHDAEYSPKDSEQPLRYILRFILKLHLEQKSNTWPFNIFSLLSLFLYLFDNDDDLKKAVSQFASESKKTNGFEVIQGENLLKIK